MVLSPVFKAANRLESGDARFEQSIALDGLRANYRKPLNLPSGRLFGTDGIRGNANELLTPALAFRIGFCAGQVLRGNAQHPFILGWDSRNSSEQLAIALSDGLAAAGASVWQVGLCPTPMVSFLCHFAGAAAGVMISASHNPPQDNGIKFFGADGTKLSSTQQQEIEVALRQENSVGVVFPNQTGLSFVNRADLAQAYVDALHAPLKGQLDLTGMRVVLDLAWGSATRFGEQLFQALGAEVIALHASPNGDRINVNCGSTHPALMQAAIQAYNADLGFAFDGDADRAIAMDNKGRLIDGDYILYLWGNLLKRQGNLPGDMIISTVMANLGFERAWQRQGGHLIRTAVGDQHVHTEMRKQGAILGGEQSGHIICHHYSISGDGLQTALHLAHLVKQSGVSMADLRDQSFQTFPQLLRNVRVVDRDRRLNWQDCDPIQRSIAQAEAEMGDQGRVLVRASGTEPVIRVMVEAVDAATTEYWTSAIAETVQLHLVA
jgi:phosphoglucosamine mutase